MCSMRLIPKENHLIREAYDDFILSRRAALLSDATIVFYEYTVGGFVKNAEISDPSQINSRLVRDYLTRVRESGVSSSTVHGHARGIRAFVRFLHAEEYVEKQIQVTMPRVEVKPMRLLSEEELGKVLKVCRRPRDKALILFMVDTGLRRSEVLYLDWLDVDIARGVVNVRRTKNKKPRSVFIGAKTRRALMKYRRTVSHVDNQPLFQTVSGRRFESSGLRQVFRRISERAGIKFSAHDLRRTFATLSLRNGMNPLHVQSMLGHSSLEMTRRYIQLVKDDLIQAHSEHGPIDGYLFDVARLSLSRLVRLPVRSGCNGSVDRKDCRLRWAGFAA